MSEGRGPLRYIREVVLGSRDRLGLWTLPLFIGVGLLGAVLAGSLTTVHYAGRVAALERETAEARRELAAAVDRVSEAAEEGVAAIEREVSGVLDQLAVNAPVEDPLEHGLVAVRATVVVQRPSAAARQQPPADDAGDEDDSDDDPADGSDEEPEPEPAPQPRTQTRYGSGFAVIVSEDETFFVTSFAVVADPLRPGAPVETAQVLVGGAVVDARVHSWDARRDVALLRTGQIAGIRLPEWRAVDEPVRPGDHLFLSGLTPRGSLVQLRAGIGGVDEELIIADTAVPDLLRGGPALDAQGRLVGVVSTAYAPHGAGGSNRPVVPVRLLCEQLIRCGDGDLGAN